MPRTITLEFPIPDMQKSSIHGNGNRFAKAKTIKQLRGGATWTVLNKYNGVRLGNRCLISYRFYVPDKRRRDEANMIQACKPFIDGIVDAKLISGDHWEVLSIIGVETKVDRERPRVEIVITEEIAF